jgi:folate-binding protein YgfZ
MTLRFAQLKSRALIGVQGPDWRSFLQGLISSDVEGLAPGQMRFAALLTPQGRLLYDMFVIGAEGGCRLDVQAAQREELIQRLMIYRLRAKVEIAPLEGVVCALWDAGSPPVGESTGEAGVGGSSPSAGAGQPPSRPSGGLPPEGEDQGFIPDPRLGALGWRGVDQAPPPGATIADEDAFDAHRLALGAPDPARDCRPDKTYPIEADFDLLNGIDFKKGCYVGQETTSRMKRRGGIRSRMLPIVFEGAAPPFGAEVLAGELRAGEVLSGREGRAMALLRLDRIEGAQLTVEGRPARVERPSWMGHG